LPHSTDMTALALSVYAPGLVVFSLLKVLIPVFYAQQDIKTPVRIGIACTCLSLVLKLIFMWPLKHAGIALATVIATSVEVMVLFVLIHRRFGSPGWSNILNSFLKIFAAAVVMGIVAYVINHACRSFLGSHNVSLQITRIISLCAAIGLAVIAYGAAAFVFRCEEINEFLHALRRKSDDQ